MPLFRLSCLFVIGMLAPPAPAESNPQLRWIPARWNGEAAFVLATPRWSAIVSVDRGRLIAFQPAGEDVNLLYAPPDHNGAHSWGGHRVWLGPQADWSAGWPPPAAWEASAAESVRADGGRLELTMPPAPGGWPRLARIYESSGGRLVCRVRASGGSRPAQIIQIFQTPTQTRVFARAAPSDRWPRGFVSLRPGGRGEPAANFPVPPQARLSGDKLALDYNGAWVKLGFPPQELQAARGNIDFRIGAPQFSGGTAGSPDAGFFTQVYLGSPASPVVELEQLSPLIPAGAVGELDVSIDLMPEKR